MQAGFVAHGSFDAFVKLLINTNLQYDKRKQFWLTCGMSSHERSYYS